ncbi:Golgi-associated plant pathogenesis-related protein 1-like [Scaptodrosophila lebanonensis]|uniref:Golgi-associated plant pathogenesis-related protein 1-like n=1 Tax=Drosophila lebanonensis TaxID=7225 RepID=A0A6J2T9P5_DROLE|nr:Golgi-associated plant pathogenesis-related protein 1-like [Scaptodrosophila lebanonensis]
MTMLAAGWAEKLAVEGIFKHSTGRLGENLFSTTGPKFDCVASWYSVWKSTASLGVGKYTQKKKTVVVVNYAPAGNVIGKFKQNVMPLKEMNYI